MLTDSDGERGILPLAAPSVDRPDRHAEQLRDLCRGEPLLVEAPLGQRHATTIRDQLLQPLTLRTYGYEMTKDGWASHGIGAAIRSLRKRPRPGLQRGLSQTGLAERMTRLGYPISQEQVSQIEKRARNRSVSIDELLAFAAALDITPSALLVEAYEQVPFGARQGIADNVHLVDWLYSTRPLDGQDPAVFERHLPTHLLYTGGAPTRLPTRFLQFTLTSAMLLRAAERKLDDDIVDAINGLRQSLKVIKTGDDVERVRSTLTLVLKSLNKILLDQESQTAQTVTQCAEQLDDVLNLLRPALLRGTKAPS